MVDNIAVINDSSIWRVRSILYVIVVGSDGNDFGSIDISGSVSTPLFYIILIEQGQEKKIFIIIKPKRLNQKYVPSVYNKMIN